MVFDRRFNAASPRYLGSASNVQLQSDGLSPAAPGLLRPLDPVLLNGVWWQHTYMVQASNRSSNSAVDDANLPNASV